MWGISTGWNYKSNLDTREWFNNVKELGINALELSYRTTHEKLNDIEGLLEEFGFKVNSIHNFCPIPNDQPTNRHPSNYYRLSALDEQERMKAIQWTNTCVDTAKRFGAKVVIIHAGSLDIEHDPSKKLLKLYSRDEHNTADYQEILNDVIEIREAQRGPFIQALEESLVG